MCLIKTTPFIYRWSHNQTCDLNTKDLFYINLPYTEAPNVLDQNMKIKIKIIFSNVNTMSFCSKPLSHNQSLLTWISHTWEIQPALKMNTFAKEMKGICNG